MTFSNRWFRGLALSALAVGLWSLPAAAQNGSNFHVGSNEFDIALAGVGSGGGAIAGDGVGFWQRGEIVSGGSLVDLDGDGTKDNFGYRASGFRNGPCVIGPPIPGLRIFYPAITVIEYDGRNSNLPDVFLRTNCVGGSSVPGALAPPVLGADGPQGLAGQVPYGLGPGATSSFFFSLVPSGTGIPSTIACLIPNNGLSPSAAGGTATIIAAAASAALPIASTGFCWGVQFGWAPSALASEEAIDGWWWWYTNSPDGNQAWGMSTDEMNAWQSQTVASEGGYSQSAIRFFTANTGFENYGLSVNPVTQDALGGYGLTQGGVYYGNSTLSAGAPNGIDLSDHVSISATGPGGVLNPTSGLGNQDPAATVGGFATLGFATWNNKLYASPAGGRLTWVQPDFDKAAGIDPAFSTSATFFVGQVRAPVNILASAPAPYPNPITNILFPFYTHFPATLGAVPDPQGFGAGAFGVPPIWGVSGSLPIAVILPPGPVPYCGGLQLGIEYGSNGIGPFTWNPSINEVSSQMGVDLML